MIEPGFGFNPDAKLSAEGFNNVLTLRQEIEGGRRRTRRNISTCRITIGR